MSIDNTLDSLTPIIRGHIKDLAQKDGRISFDYLGDPTFTIPNSFVSASSIKVFVNNVQIGENDFTFDAETNQVTIDFEDSSEELETTDIIVITYHYFKSYSDEEIKQYIASALTYFVQYRYKKTFEIIDEEIVSVNDVSPTINELNFITIIASILIDPQNINIDTPEFKLSRNRDESDQKQIERAFIKFNRFIGSITFNNTDYYGIK